MSGSLRVLVCEPGRGIGLSWEAESARGLQCFAAVQAAAASRRCSVEEAFEACFGSTPAPALKRWSERLARTLGVGNGFAQLCFHACWLHHARMASQWHGVKAGGFSVPSGSQHG